MTGVVILGAAVFLALALLPFASGLGMATKALERRFGCEGARDIQFPRFPERSTVVAADGKVLARLYLDENRVIVHLRDVAPVARRAVLAIEDHNFYQHGGVDLRAIFRAAIADIRSGEFSQGGSTITQQLVKNVTKRSADTFRRKLNEACEAIEVERHYTKRQILELYLNDIFFGHGVYGIETASQFYFHKHASHLNLRQSALLAGMIARPAGYDPLTYPKHAIRRRNVVLAKMAEYGWISEDRDTAAVSGPLGLAEQAGQKIEPRNPFFVQYITRQILQNETGEYNALGQSYQQRRHTLFQGGLQIYTTLNPTWVNYGLDAIRSRLPLPTDPQAAISTVDTHTGAIRALVSGRNFRETKQDLVTGLNGTAGRQAGSSFKPYTLVAAFRQGIPPGKVYNSKSPIFIPQCNNWHVENAEPGTGGYVDLWKATEDSINVVFAQLIRDVGPENVVQAAHDMGITSPLPPVCSLTLGAGSVSPLDMSSGYATLANNGKHCPPYAVEKIVGPRGRAIYRHDPEVACKQVVSPDIAHLVTAMLEKVVCCGTGTAANIGRPQAGKTGTHEEFTNAWFIGYVPQYSTAVWVGYPNEQRPMYGVEGFGEVFGGTIPALIWHDYMSRVVQGLPVEGFPAPPAPERGKVPPVVGLKKGQAVKILVEANFTPIPKFVRSREPAGTVVAQSPAAGTKILLGSIVHISVSNGEAPAPASERHKGRGNGGGQQQENQMAKVPNVVGLSEPDARSKLQSKGFGVQVVEAEVRDKSQNGIVLDQDPNGQTQAPEGSIVTITVGKYKPHGRHGH